MRGRCSPSRARPSGLTVCISISNKEVMKQLFWVGLVIWTGCASSSELGTLVGRVRFINSGGGPNGEASLFAVPDGIRIIANLPGLSGGDHGFHFHSVAECQGPTFESAGPHFNPTG